MASMYRWVFAVAVAAAAPCMALAADAPSTDADAKQPAVDSPATTSAPAAVAPSSDSNFILRAFKAKGAAVSYLGRLYGLDGWLLTKDADLQVIYTTTDGQGAVVGTLYGPTGMLETEKQLMEARKNGLVPASVTTAPADVPPPVEGVNSAAAVASRGTAGQEQPVSASPAASQPAVALAAPVPGSASALPSERLWAQVQSTTYLKYGPDTLPPLYVVMDPRCHYCHDLYETISSKYRDKLQLRVIPVGILSEESIKEAEKIVSASDPTKTWDEIEQGNQSDLGAITSDGSSKIANNGKLVSDWKFQGTPTCVYRNKAGKVKLVVGIPSDMGALLNDIGSG